MRKAQDFLISTTVTLVERRTFLFLQSIYSSKLNPPYNDQVPIIMTGTLYSSNECHSGSLSLKWDELRTERKTIMFLSSKLCLLIALPLGWLLMDITFYAVPQATVWSSVFWNEQLCDAPLKLVQCSIIHHLQHCQRVAPMSQCLPVTIGLQELLSANSQWGTICTWLEW